MKGRLHTAEKFNKFGEPGITARIPATADRDPFDISPFCLEVCKGLVSNGFESLKTAVLFLDPPGAVIASFLEREAIPAPEWLDTPDMFKVTVLAESAAVNARTSTDVNSKVSHFKYCYLRS
jgi:hypothetical protein